MKFPDLENVIGTEAAVKLCEMYGGCQEKIPKVPPTERNKQILRMFCNGVPRAAIARSMGLHYVTVCKIISEG